MPPLVPDTFRPHFNFAVRMSLVSTTYKHLYREMLSTRMSSEHEGNGQLLVLRGSLPLIGSPRTKP